MVKLLYAYTDRLPRNPISGRSIHFAVDTSTTVTVIRSSGRSERCFVRKENLQDACPDTLFAPALIAAGHRGPGSETLRQFAPRGACAHDPEHALHNQTMIDRRTARL